MILAIIIFGIYAHPISLQSIADNRDTDSRYIAPL